MTKLISTLCFSVVFTLLGCKTQPSDTTVINGPEATAPEFSLDAIQISFDRHSAREIEGELMLDRDRYFSLCHPGKDFDRNAKSTERVEYLVKDLGVRFGRALGPIQGQVSWNKAVIEDADRPGFAEADHLKERASRNPYKPSPVMKEVFGDNLNVVAHGNHNAYPEWMGKHSNDTVEQNPGAHPETIPANIPAAVELAVGVFKNAYTDFDRPRYYEPLNEPHWGYFDDPQLGNWHMALNDAFDKEVPDTLVGGMCMSVGYFYKNNYNTWSGLKKFIDRTSGTLDFYSFHAYDYMDWSGDDFNGGRVTSGLPLEGVLDMIPNYMHNTFTSHVDVVLSEHGGYVTGQGGKSSDELADEIAQKYFPGEGFDWEMKRRSIMEFNLVSTCVANTLTFMDHPHVVKKAVPFILLESMDWDPHYYSTLYVAKDYTNKNEWVEGSNVHFFKLFAGIEGRRIVTQCPDPDIQTRGFADGKRIALLFNNLWTKPETLALDLKGASKVTVRRITRQRDFTPAYSEQEFASLSLLQIGSREAVVVIAEFSDENPVLGGVKEVVTYGDRITIPIATNVNVKVAAAVNSELAYANLRLAYVRPSELSASPVVLINDVMLDVPQEDCKPRITDDKEYATTKLISVDPKLLEAENVVTIRFAEKGGTIGSVALRVAEAWQSR